MNQSESNNPYFKSSNALHSIGAKISLLVLSVIVMFLLGGVIDIFAAGNMLEQADDQAALINMETELAGLRKISDENYASIPGIINNENDADTDSIKKAFGQKRNSIQNLRSMLDAKPEMLDVLNNLESSMNQEELFLNNMVITQGSPGSASSVIDSLISYEKIHAAESKQIELLQDDIQVSMNNWHTSQEGFMKYEQEAQAITTILAMVLGIAAALIMSKRIGKRLGGLEKAVVNVAEGDLEQSVQVSGHDEISRLGESFNKMAVALRQETSKLSCEQTRIRSVHQAITDGIIVYDRFGLVISANPAAEAVIGMLESEIIGGQKIGIPEVEKQVTAPDLVPDEQKVKCWQEKNCTHPECPSYESNDLRCWLQCGTCCHNEIQGTFSQKRDACERCDVYAKNGLLTTEITRDGLTYSVWIGPVLENEGNEEGRIVVFHDVSYMRAAQESLLEHNRELTVINEVTAALTRSLDDTTVAFDDVLEIIASHFRVSSGAVMLLEKNDRNTELAAFKGFSSQGVLYLRLLNLADEISMAMKSGTSFIEADEFIKRHKSISGILSKENLVNPAIVPLWAKGDIVGILMLLDENRKEYDENDRRLLTALASQIGTAVQNTELFSSVEKAKRAWETTFDAMDDGVSVHDVDCNILRVNDSMARLFGVSNDELLNNKCYQVIHGRSSPIALCPRKEVERTGKSVSMEIDEPKLDKTFRLSVSPIKNSKGDVVGLVHVMRNVTERKQMREQLLQSEKMAAVGQLVSGVAHELNNPLTGVVGYSQLLLRRCEEDQGMSSITRDVSSIHSEAQRASKIVQNLLSFARKRQPQKSSMDINEAIRMILELRAYELNIRNMEIVAELNSDLPRVIGDVHQLEQVLLNIVNNAEQAMEATGRPGRIEIRTDASRDTVSISIKDNGAGISVKNAARIFDPFFTTKEVGKGTGLGLSICYGIIEEHGGTIRAESRENEGTTIMIELPTAGVEDGYVVPTMGVVTKNGGCRRVLVVDDEPAIVELLTDILTMEGHGVDVAKNGRLALRKLANSNYDNIITDIKMPEMDGRELHRRIREIDPELAANVIFITGDSISVDTKDYLDQTGNFYLVKPFNLNELRETLNKVMNKNGK